MVLSGKKFLLSLSCFLCCVVNGGYTFSGEPPPFRLDPAREAFILAAAGGLNLLGGYCSERPVSPVPLSADEGDVPGFERFACRLYSRAADDMSDRTLNLARAVPVLVSILSIRSSGDSWRRVLVIEWLLYVESSALVLGLTKTAKETFRRRRPYVYNPAVPAAKRSSADASRSMWSGHAAQAFNAAVFAGYTFQEYEPESPLVKYVWGIGLTCAAATAALRVRAGQHFPTDVAAGAAVGSFLGWFVPRLHRGGKRFLSLRACREGHPGLGVVVLF